MASTTLSAVSANALDCPPGGSRPRGPAVQAWRDLAIAKVINGNAAEVQSSIRSCFGTRVPACLKATEEYAEEKVTGVPRTSTPSPLTISSEADLPAAFLVKDSNGRPIPGKVKIPDDIFNLAARNNWKVADYKTRGTGGFDNAPNLLIVALKDTPSVGKDIFLQISPPTDAGHPGNGADPLPNPRKTNGQATLTVITADRTVNPPLGQLRLMQGQNSIYNWNNELRSAGCIECHSVPLRSISPRGFKVVNWENPMAQQDQENVEAINEMMHIQKFTWGIGQHGEKMGPREDSHPYGWAPGDSPTRTEAYVKECFDTRESRRYTGSGAYTHNVEEKPTALMNDWVKVRNAMNCVGCHDGGRRGTLHSGFSFNEIVFKVLVDRSMPPEVDLTDDERLALLTCIAKEKQQTLPVWQQTGFWMKKQVPSCGL